jgi:hypothetical protein
MAVVVAELETAQQILDDRLHQLDVLEATGHGQIGLGLQHGHRAPRV